MTYIAPKVYEEKFTCPHCGAIAHQQWEHRTWDFQSRGVHLDNKEGNPIKIVKCAHCNKHSLWLNETMLYPDSGRAPHPNSDLSEKVKKTYLEAAAISTKSPRGAAALLRLAVQYLCIDLGEKGNKINDDIASLVKKGLPNMVQQALDTVRVTGNNAVHPGVIDTDNPETVEKLFKYINVIAEYMISLPQQIKGNFKTLPKPALDAIKKRDQKS